VTPAESFLPPIDLKGRSPDSKPSAKQVEINTGHHESIEEKEVELSVKKAEKIDDPVAEKKAEQVK